MKNDANMITGKNSLKLLDILIIPNLVIFLFNLILIISITGKTNTRENRAKVDAMLNSADAAAPMIAIGNEVKPNSRMPTIDLGIPNLILSIILRQDISFAF